MNLMADILINVIIAFLAGSLLLGLHRKVIARVQLRPGPPIIQHLLHSLKFFFKESSFPKTVLSKTNEQYSNSLFVMLHIILLFCNTHKMHYHNM